MFKQLSMESSWYVQLEESSQANQQVWEANANAIAYNRQPNQPQGEEFFHPLECQPTLQIGYVFYVISFSFAFIFFFSLNRINFIKEIWEIQIYSLIN